MKVVVLAGYSGAGKTTLLEKLLPALKVRGQRVSVVKHAHHGFEFDHPGKDTWRHRQAGAFEVVACSPNRMVLQREFEVQTDTSVHQALAELYHGVDWVLVEGYRDCNLPKLEVWRDAQGRPARYPDDPFVTGVCTTWPNESQPESVLPQPTALPVFHLDQPERIADWLLAHGQRFEYDASAFA